MAAPAAPATGVPSSQTREGGSVARETGIRRVFLYLSIFFTAAITGVILEEADKPLHLVDDVALVGLSVVVIVLIAVWWKRESLPELRRTNNVAAALFVVVLLFQFFGIAVEVSDPADFGNDIPSLIGIVVLLVNRFA